MSVELSANPSAAELPPRTPEREPPPLQAPASAREGFGVRIQIRCVTAAFILLLRAARRLGPHPRPIPPEGADILLTGTFHSDNWVRAHIAPLAASRHCARIRIVATAAVPVVPKVEAIYPPSWLTRTIGQAGARLVVFAWVAVRSRPHVIAAFHLLFNGLTAALLARCVGARSMYFCVGGPAEVLYGGIWSENRFFQRLRRPDALVEQWLLEGVAAQHIVITMGTRAEQFFRSRGIATAIHVVPGGIDPDRFPPSSVEATYDAILVGRLSPIKRIDLFIRAVAELAAVRPDVKAVIVGDGPLRDEMRALAAAMGLMRNITFAGKQSDVGAWLRRSRVFVLTSDSEGLALSLMEAMMSGLPAVVSDVGDLPDLVTDDVNGYLVRDRTPQAFSTRIAALLRNDSTYRRVAAAARGAARRYETAETVRLWDTVLQAEGRPAAERRL